MIILLVISVVIGGIVAGISGIDFLFWVVSIGVFILGLPSTLIGGFVSDISDYNQDRADDREIMRQIAEDDRLDRYLDKMDDLDIGSDIYIDNRQIHFHNYGDDYEIKNTKKLDKF